MFVIHPWGSCGIICWQDDPHKDSVITMINFQMIPMFVFLLTVAQNINTKIMIFELRSLKTSPTFYSQWSEKIPHNLLSHDIINYHSAWFRSIIFTITIIMIYSTRYTTYITYISNNSYSKSHFKSDSIKKYHNSLIRFQELAWIGFFLCSLILQFNLYGDGHLIYRIFFWDVLGDEHRNKKPSYNLLWTEGCHGAMPDFFQLHPVPVLGECSNNYHQSGFYIKAKVTSIKHPLVCYQCWGSATYSKRMITIHHQNSYGERHETPFATRFLTLPSSVTQPLDHLSCNCNSYDPLDFYFNPIIQS